MKKTLLFTLVAAVAAFPFCFTIAEEEGGKGKGGKGKGRPGGGGYQRPEFSDIDTDSSGDVNKEEWLAFQVKQAQERAERSFSYIAGDDGKITQEELGQAMQRMQRRGGPKGGPGDSKGGPGGGGKGSKGGKGKGDPNSGEGQKPKRPEFEE